jgi:ribosomal protein S18 acetylase RimI-like enzyme
MTHAIDLSLVALREATPAEFDAFMARCRADYIVFIGATVGVSVAVPEATADADDAKLLPEGRETRDHFMLAIVDGDGDVLGDIWLGLNRKVDGVEAFGYDFWIRPDLRDQGVGRRAMQLAADHARGLGAIRLALNVFGDNARAQHLYRSFGFHVTNVNMTMPL